MKKSSLLWLVLSLVFLLGGCTSSTNHVENVLVAEEEEDAELFLGEEKPEVIEENGINASILYGYNKTTKGSRYMRIQADIENTTKDLFKGSFYGAFSAEGIKDPAYRQDVELQAGERTRVELAIPASTHTNELRFTLVDDNEGVIWNKTMTVEINYMFNTVFVGVLSNNRSVISYLSDTGVKTFLLDPEDFPENPLSLDTFDIIVVHDFDEKTSLNEKQQKALSKFGETGSLQYIDGELDINTTMEKVLSAMGEEQEKRLAKEARAEGREYSLINGIEINDKEEIPSIGPYIFILLGYLLLTGPPLYLLLKKFDKLNYVWGIIPLLSIAFTLIIFVLGTKTRKTEPYVGYYNIEEKNGNETTETVYFGITSPHNEAYNLLFKKENQVVSLNSQLNYSRSGFTSYRTSYAGSEERRDINYNTVIMEKDAATEVSVRDNAAFSKNYFKGTSKKIEETNLNSSITVTKDFKAIGSVSNNTGYSLTNAVLCAGDIYIQIGDIEAGETIDVSDLTQFIAVTGNDLYEGERSFLKAAAGGLPYGEDRESYISRVYYGYEYYLGERMSVFEREPGILLGVVKAREEEQPEMLEKLPWQKSGIHLIAAVSSVNYTTDGETLIPNLDAYIKEEDGEPYDVYRFSYSDTMKAEIQFDAGDKIKALIYAEDLNGEFNPDGLKGFYGRVKAYNLETDTYDVIFESGREKVLSNLEPYLNQKNQIRVLYEMGKPEDEKKGTVYPVLSAIKEAG